MSSSDAEASARNQVQVSQNDAEEELVLHSLGEALAGVNLGKQSGNSAGFSSNPVASSPFAIGRSSNQSQETCGWPSFDATDVASASMPSFASTSNSSPSGIEHHMRSEGLHLFLSEGSKQALDTFGASSGLTLGSSEEQLPGRTDTSSAFRFPGGSQQSSALVGSGSFGDARADGRRESPSTSITGTASSSRSASPYAGNNVGSDASRTIQAYRPDTLSNNSPPNQNTSSFHEGEEQNYGLPKPGSYPSLHSLESSRRSPFANDKVHSNSSAAVGYVDQTFSRTSSSSFSQPHLQSHGDSQQPQVLYMAVPAPDGRGQVLQPVQIMQAPGGKTYTYVVPGATGAASTTTPDISSSQVLGLTGATGKDDRFGGGVDSRLPFVDPTVQLGSYDATSSYIDPYTSGNLTGDILQGDPALLSLYASPQRPSLDDLLGQVRRLSRDQVGCRLVQQALDEEGPHAATRVLNEGLPFWGEAMVDPFGNYLFQKILEKVTPEERVMLIKSVSNRLVNASLNLHGTRSVQKVVDLCAMDEKSGYVSLGGQSAADILTQSLAPAAARLCIDSHGNHVIQRILLKLGPQHSKFIFDAVAISVGDVARHRHGCCVIQRCLDFPDFAARRYLVERIVEKSLELMQDAYGNYVVQYVLDVCSDHDVQAVCESVVGKVNLLSIQKFSSNVMEKCLERCNDHVKALYLEEVSDTDRVRELMMDPFGNYVVQRALSVATHSQAVRLVEAMKPHLMAQQVGGPHGQRNGGVRNTAGGRRIIAKICRRFPNFSLNDMLPQEEVYAQGPARNNNHYYRQQRSAPVGYAPGHHGVHQGTQQQYSGGNRIPGGNMHLASMQQGQQQQQQQQSQPYYNAGGSSAYDRYTGGHGYGGYNGF